MNIAITRKLFITITITILNMNKENPSILDIFKAISMQISVWRWEARMISKYGLDWGYKEPIQRDSLDKAGVICWRFDTLTPMSRTFLFFRR